MDNRALAAEHVLVKFRLKTLIPKRLRRRVRELVTGIKLDDLGAADFYVTDDALEDALYLLAVARRPRARPAQQTVSV